MSARPATAYEPWSAVRANALIAAHLGRDGALLPILHDLMDMFGYIHAEAEPLIAQALNISRAEVHGVVTFYHDFRREPAGRHVLRLCRAEACQAAGGRSLAERTQRMLGIGFGETSADGRITLEAVYCLGLCATAPTAMRDGRVVGRLDDTRLNALLAEAQP